MMNVYDELEKRGVIVASVSFSGGGDEGGADDIILTHKDGHTSELDPYQYGTCGDDYNLVTALAEPLYEKYGGFAGEFHVSGTLVYDVVGRTKKMSGYESVEHEEYFEN